MRWHEIIAEGNYTVNDGDRVATPKGPGTVDGRVSPASLTVWVKLDSGQTVRFNLEDITESTGLTEDDDLGGMIEDEADSRGDAVLATALEELRNRAHGHNVPRVRVDSLVNLVKSLPGGEAFNVDALNNARKSNDTIKELIKDIKDDENGIKYVYLTTFNDDDFGDSESTGDNGAKTAPEKTVDSMAKRAASNRS